MVEYHRDEVKRRLLWVAHGEVTLEEILQVTARQIADGAWPYPLLYDAREREGSLTAGDLHQLSDAIAEYSARLGPRGRIAIVVSADAHGQGQMYSLVSSRLEGNHQVFRDVADAERWLDEG